MAPERPRLLSLLAWVAVEFVVIVIRKPTQKYKFWSNSEIAAVVWQLVQASCDGLNTIQEHECSISIPNLQYQR